MVIFADQVNVTPPPLLIVFCSVVKLTDTVFPPATSEQTVLVILFAVGAGSTVTVKFTTAPVQLPEPPGPVAATAYVTEPDVAPLLTSTSVMAEPDGPVPFVFPVISPVTLITVHENVLPGIDGVIILVGELPLQIVSGAITGTIGSGLTVTITAIGGSPTHVVVELRGRIKYSIVAVAPVKFC